MPGIEPWSLARKPNALPTELQTQHARTGGGKADGVRKRAERRRVERERTTGAETGGVRGAHITRSGEGRKACFPSLGDADNSAQKLCIEAMLKGSVRNVTKIQRCDITSFHAEPSFFPHVSFSLHLSECHQNVGTRFWWRAEAAHGDFTVNVQRNSWFIDLLRDSFGLHLVSNTTVLITRNSTTTYSCEVFPD